MLCKQVEKKLVWIIAGRQILESKIKYNTQGQYFNSTPVDQWDVSFLVKLSFFIMENILLEVKDEGEKTKRENEFQPTDWFVLLINEWFKIMAARSLKLALSKNNEEPYVEALSHLRLILSDLG